MSWETKKKTSAFYPLSSSSAAVRPVKKVEEGCLWGNAASVCVSRKGRKEGGAEVKGLKKNRGKGRVAVDILYVMIIIAHGFGTENRDASLFNVSFSEHMAVLPSPLEQYPR